MAYEHPPPKFARVITEIQQRIESGKYPPGSLLPSEHSLSAEFDIARPTVVRALRVLREDGWIETKQGKGSFVRGRPALASVTSPRRGQAELDRDESREPGELVSAAMTRPPARVAALLGLASADKALCRRRLIRHDGEASEIVTWWIPADLAEGTDVASEEPLPGGIRAHLARRKKMLVDHVIEQVVARYPDPAEAKLLGLAKTAPVLALYAVARDATGKPLLAIDIAMPGDLHELEDAYQIT